MAEPTPCIGYDARSRRPCDRAAITTVIAGCEHEHLGPREVCDWHADDLQQGQMVCGDCQGSTQPHTCRLHVLVQPTP